MKSMLAVFAVLGFVATGAMGAVDSARGVYAPTPVTSGARGNQGLANAYRNNQRTMYYMVTQPDVDTACRNKIYNC